MIRHSRHDDASNSVTVTVIPKFIPAIPDRVSLAIANPGVKVLASDNFTGCKYQLWKDKDGQFIGAHAYKGVAKEASIVTEATGKGWTRV